MNDCLFCKIARGEIPSTKVYEDDKVFVFRDIEPKAPTHMLVIPKEHIESVAAVTSSNSTLVAHAFEVIAKICEDREFSTGFRVVSNCGEDSGQTVQHLHFHVLAGKKMGEFN